MSTAARILTSAAITLWSLPWLVMLVAFVWGK